jgi:hypothetical protein
MNVIISLSNLVVPKLWFVVLLSSAYLSLANWLARCRLYRSNGPFLHATISPASGLSISGQCCDHIGS